MAHLWLTDVPRSEWAALPLEGAPLSLSLSEGGGLRVQRAPAAGTPPRAGGLLLHDAGTPRDQWVFLCSVATKLFVSGLPLPTGIRVLRDRDELRLAGGERFFFSTEELAAVVPFPDSAPAIFCPRCKQELAFGTPAVRCPNERCRGWYHQFDALPCWTYAEQCFLCGQHTALSSGFRWSPDDY